MGNFNRPPGGLPRNINGAHLLQGPQKSVQVNVEHIDIPGGKLPELAQPVTINFGSNIKILGGMTKRLAVAAAIVGHCSAAGQSSEEACRSALSLADILIEMERADRFPRDEDPEKQGGQE